MKKILIMSMALFLIGCSHQTQAMIETTVSETATAADQASKEVEELTKLEEEGKIEYDEVSGDIINAEQEEQNQDMMNVIRQEVIDGDIRGVEIDEEVDMWCDFLDTEAKAEFKSELHLLEVKEAEVVPETTKPQPTKPSKSQTSNQNQPKETQDKSAPQPTQATEVYQESAPQQTEPVVNEPAPTQPQNNTSGEIDTSGWNTGGVKVEVVTPDADQSLSPEQNEAINNAQW